MTGEECERVIAAAWGRSGAALCSRATVGLAAALRALGLPRGRGVIAPVMGCANVAHAIRGAGLRPLWADVELQRGGVGIRLESAERLAGEGCGALLAMPLFGGEVEHAALGEFARRHGLLLVEDGAQGRVGDSNMDSSGDSQAPGAGVLVVSFGKGKVLDAGGGGAVLCDDEELLRRVRAALPGGAREIRHDSIAQVLEGRHEEVAGRERMARLYRDALHIEGVEQVGRGLPLWKYSVLVPSREARGRVTRELLRRGVEATNLYPPLSLWFDEARGKEHPGAWGIWSRIVNLPLWGTRGSAPAEWAVEQAARVFTQYSTCAD